MTDIRRRTLMFTGGVLPLVVAEAANARDAAQESHDAAALSAALNDGPRLASISVTFADGAMTYSAGPGQVMPGQIVATRQEGQAYQVAAPDAATYDVETGAGVRLIVLPTPQGFNARAFGARGDDASDDTAALQRAIDAANARNINAVLVPDGVYRTIAPLDLPASVSLIGNGERTCFKPTATDFLTIQSNPGIAPRRIADFWVYGQNCLSNTAFKADLSHADPSAQRAFRLMIERIYVSFYGWAADMRGVWHTTFRGCMFHKVRSGIKIHGKSIKTLIDDCSLQTDETITGTSGDATGIVVGSETDPEGLNPEGVRVNNTIIFGFRIAVDWVHCLSGSLVAVDLDYCQYGVRVAKAYGGFTVADCWIGIGSRWNGAPIGLYFAAQARALSQLVDIHGNHFVVYDAYAEYHGITAEAGHAFLKIHENDIGTGFKAGIQMTATYHAVIANNYVASGTNVFRTVQGLDLRGNVFGAGVALDGNINADYGKNHGVTTRHTGRTSMPAGKAEVTYTWAELGISALPTASGAGYDVRVTASGQGALSRGVMRGECSSAGITIHAQSAVKEAGEVIYEIAVY